MYILRDTLAGRTGVLFLVALATMLSMQTLLLLLVKISR